ncbi:SDR family NAD(P)-dependent oxidoreductase [Paraburkholderia phymatum]|uniref:SDR family NAD(P)-dependent oxidoreductase n=1 Tax=Paraburkholderia phymatum TaxID=148447 RepID=UPI003173DF95
MAMTVVITGGFGTLGAAVGRAFKAAGANVGLIDHALSPTDEVAREFTGQCLLGGVDLTSFDAAQAALRTVAAKFGGLDALINVAGGFRWETVEEGSLDTWDDLYSMNLKTAVSACKAAIPLLIARGGGRIVNIGAAAASRGGLGMGAYAASKSALARMTESLAEELKDRNITVNAILPAIIDTPVNRQEMPDADFLRWVQPVSIANVISFLVSAQASAVTGAQIPVTHRC